MNAGVLAIGALAGYIVYEKVLAPGAANSGATPSKEKQNLFSSLFGIGSQPATGNGQNLDTTASDIAKGAGALFNFGSSLLNYWGTSDKDANNAGTQRDSSQWVPDGMGGYTQG